MRDIRNKTGSALILVVVLTSLLAIVGVTFIMAARVNRMATSGISDRKDLDSAVDTVVARISQELAADVPGAYNGWEYCDYPGDEDKWLACLEPYDNAGTYKWRHISDIYNKLGSNSDLDAELIDDYQPPSEVGNSNGTDYPADADGDGVADSRWVEIGDDITSSKGKPIYAAIRVIDNGAMLNVNTAYKFDPNSGTQEDIDGSRLTQINLFALAQRNSFNDINDLDDERFGNEPHNLDDYIRDVIWQYNEPNGLYTPFDIADELEIRNRFMLNREDVDSRLENVWVSAFQSGPLGHPYLSVPVGSATSSTLPKWIKEVYFDNPSDPNDPKEYSYRHIGTSYNMDRIINPFSGKMLNINTADKDSLYYIISNVLMLDPNFSDSNDLAAQITVNLIDFRDSDSDVTDYRPQGSPTTYYGFEQPCVYISELAYAIKDVASAPPPSVYRQAYAVELYKPYSSDDDPNNWRLQIIPAAGSPIINNINWNLNRQYYVMQNDPCYLLPVDTNNAELDDCNNLVLGTNDVVRLQRCIDDVNGVWITVDSRTVPNGFTIAPSPGIYASNSLRRDIGLYKCIRRLWSGLINGSTLGDPNNGYSDPNTRKIQAHPANTNFTNIGEIGMVFRKCAYTQGPNSINSSDSEADVRINLENSRFQKLFNYLTRFDPTDDGIDNNGDGIGEFGTDPNELKIPGRININTAPWFVLAQLPWMRYEDSTPYDRAIAVINKRDSSPDGFRNIGELLSVNEMKNLGSDGKDNLNTDSPKGPDITPDTAQDDLEERDAIFARISDLITVRSDVFSAYILVRIGNDGPQKRVMAILDRSDVSPGVIGKVKVRVLQPVPDPR